MLAFNHIHLIYELETVALDDTVNRGVRGHLERVLVAPALAAAFARWHKVLHNLCIRTGEIHFEMLVVFVELGVEVGDARFRLFLRREHWERRGRVGNRVELVAVYNVNYKHTIVPQPTPHIPHKPLDILELLDAKEQ